MVIRGKRGSGELEKSKWGQTYGDGRRLTLGGERTMQYTDDVLCNCTLETYIILLTNVTPINLIKIERVPLLIILKPLMLQLLSATNDTEYKQ